MGGRTVRVFSFLRDELTGPDPPECLGIVWSADQLLTNMDKFGQLKCRDDKWEKYINWSEELCKVLYIGGNPVSWFPFGLKVRSVV